MVTIGNAHKEKTAGQTDSRWEDDRKSLTTGVAILVGLGRTSQFNVSTFYVIVVASMCVRNSNYEYLLPPLICNRKRPWNVALCYLFKIAWILRQDES
jgi:hypothetical protein